jgi:hypothetical protein
MLDPEIAVLFFPEIEVQKPVPDIALDDFFFWETPADPEPGDTFGKRATGWAECCICNQKFASKTELDRHDRESAGLHKLKGF